MTQIGFIGLGLMGEPMALNLLDAGQKLLAWNRTPAKLDPVVEAGAEAAASVEEIFDRCATVILMLAGPDATDAILGRGRDAFARIVRGKLIVNTGTAPPAWSASLAAQVAEAGGRYVEAPVSGSRQQAQERRLVVMLAGERRDVADARDLLAPICQASFDCGVIPGALRMKLAVNLYMIVMVSGLVEAFHFAERAGIDPAVLRDVLAVSPMASNVSQVKAGKLAARDWTAQAAISDVLRNVDLVREAAAGSGAVAPLIDSCRELFSSAVADGNGELDMVGVSNVLHRWAERADA